eukprot:Seg164.16 transcript_id=Seg164.16/GoldUCD/mRNA.D3Y31 product="Synaptobrevin YKT6" protein_id=Seg164.16/GoldUCD/D3Y31
MKLYGVTILYKGSKVTLLKRALDLQSFSFFQRGSVREFMDFTAKLLVERTQAGLRASVKEQEQVLQRGEKLDDLVTKSEGLSSSSKAFYTTARKTNSCCGW